MFIAINYALTEVLPPFCIDKESTESRLSVRF